jgi:ElaB/YqjD/DUF883 family membrane-anchored ribosome-binding protein
MKMPALRKVSWEDGSDSAARLWNQARESSEDLLYQVNRQVRRHPWKAVVVALGAGLILGALVSRSARS